MIKDIVNDFNKLVEKYNIQEFKNLSNKEIIKIFLDSKYFIDEIPKELRISLEYYINNKE